MAETTYLLVERFYMIWFYALVLWWFWEWMGRKWIRSLREREKIMRLTKDHIAAIIIFHRAETWYQRRPSNNCVETWQCLLTYRGMLGQRDNFSFQATWDLFPQSWTYSLVKRLVLQLDSQILTKGSAGRICIPLVLAAANASTNGMHIPPALPSFVALQAANDWQKGHSIPMCAGRLVESRWWSYGVTEGVERGRGLNRGNWVEHSGDGMGRWADWAWKWVGLVAGMHAKHPS